VEFRHGGPVHGHGRRRRPLVLPSKSEIDALRIERDALALNLSRLQQLGGRVDWHHCGDEARLCVRVDRKAPVYGDQSDFFVVKGY